MNLHYPQTPPDRRGRRKDEVQSLDDMDPKARRKLSRIMRRAFFSIGGGIGLMLVKLAFPGFDPEKAAAIFDGIGWALVACGALTVLTFLFKRGWLFKVDLVLTWIILPALIFKAAMGAF